VEKQNDLVSVRLLGFPLDLQLLAAARNDALMRELALMRTDLPDTSVPNRLHALVEDLTRRFSGFSDLPTAEIEAARARSDESIDLEYRLPPAAGEAARAYNDLLDEVNDFCRAGRHLVTLEETPELADFRRWVLSEFAAQIAGAPPTPWPRFRAAARAATDGHPSAPAPAEREDPHPAGADPHADADADAHADADADHTTVIAYQGELDIATAESLRRQINELRDHGVRDVIIDARDITFIDSVGLSILIALHLRLAETGDSLMLRSPSPAVLRTLETAGIVDRLVLDAPA
jgi:anti-anti-sigma factor